jgi:hypothetical protein
MKSFVKNTIMAVAVLYSAANVAHAAIINGSFEDPSVTPGGFQVFGNGSNALTGWTVVGAPGNVATVSGTYTSGALSFPAQAGLSFLDLTGLSNTATGVQQLVTTTAGTTYDLSFWVGNVNDTQNIFGTTSTVNLLVDGIQTFVATNSTGGSTQTWQQFSTQFVATSSSTTIAFINADPSSDNHNGLDNVDITTGLEAVPEPASLAVCGGGLALLGVLARRKHS